MYGYSGRDSIREIQEAIAASEAALDHLFAADGYLNKAGNWGMVDILGGGWITTYIKRNSLEEARNEMAAAQRAVLNLRKELLDVPSVNSLGLDIDDFLAFADYFFDGFLADIMVQSRISEAQRKVHDTIDEIQRIRTNLVDAYNNAVRNGALNG
ncbi:MAG: hypothetical protein ACOX6J_02870 [Oscillospiraceae bacterium]|jgi:hypothetical protein